jgi:hypothetical protein
MPYKFLVGCGGGSATSGGGEHPSTSARAMAHSLLLSPYPPEPRKTSLPQTWMARQTNGGSMQARLRCVLGFALLIVFAACGSGPYNFNHVSVSVSPAAVTIPTNGQVTLQATVSGLCSNCVGSIQYWSIAEDPNNGVSCYWFTTPPAGPCPGGTIQPNNNQGSFNTLTVTYYAPSTPGTFHVSAVWCICEGSSQISKTGTSVVTVDP